MKLSEAIMVGSVTCRMVSGDMNSCALGVACNAVGIPLHTERYYFTSAGKLVILGFNRYTAMKSIWPWLNDFAGNGFLRYGPLIARLFDYNVHSGRMTLEQLVDTVRIIEPQCGICNRFTCSCALPPLTELVPTSTEAELPEQWKAEHGAPAYKEALA